MTATQLKIFRISLGLYLAVRFSHVLLHQEFYHPEGAFLPLSSQSYFLPTTVPDFPGVFRLFPGLAVWLTGFGGALTALIFGSGFLTRTSALLSWYLWAGLLDRFPAMTIPEEAFIGWLLLAAAVMGKEGFASVKLQRALWILTGITFAASGLLKLQSPSWRSGRAAEEVLSAAVARPWTDALTPGESLSVILTFGALFAEFLPLLLIWFRKGRIVSWYVLSFFHLINFFLFGITAVSFGFFVTQLFLWEEHARPRFRTRSQREGSVVSQPG